MAKKKKSLIEKEGTAAARQRSSWSVVGYLASRSPSPIYRALGLRPAAGCMGGVSLM